MYHRTFSRRARIRVFSFLLGGFLVAAGFAGQAYQGTVARADNYELRLALCSRSAFSQLSTYLSEIDTALQKSVYATSPTMAASLCTEIYGKAMAAQFALGTLPYSNLTLERTGAFIARLGDYALSLSRRAAAQEVYSEGDLDNLYALSGTAAWLSQGVLDMQQNLSSGEQSLETLEQAEARFQTPESAGAGGGFQAVEEEFPEVPSLIYDGPFSQHLEQQSPRSLEGKTELGEDEAKTAAAAFFDLDPASLSPACSGEGKLPFYGFSGDADGEVFVSVTRQGGAPLLLYRLHTMGEASLSAEEAVRTAADFLSQRGYAEMHESYHIKTDGILTVNFAATQDEVILYPDLVKVSVALDDGSILGFEAAGYVMNHTARGLPAAAVSAEAAQKQVAPNLTVLSHAMAVIPTAGKNEVLCHEFICVDPNGLHCITYVNAQTGAQEKILLLIEDESGTLAI